METLAYILGSIVGIGIGITILAIPVVLGVALMRRAWEWGKGGQN